MKKVFYVAFLACVAVGCSKGKENDSINLAGTTWMGTFDTDLTTDSYIQATVVLKAGSEGHYYWVAKKGNGSGDNVINWSVKSDSVFFNWIDGNWKFTYKGKLSNSKTQISGKRYSQYEANPISYTTDIILNKQ